LFTGGGIESSLKAFGSVGTVFSIVDAIASSCAEPSWSLYRKARNGSKEERTLITSHAALVVINKPNDFFTFSEIIESIIQYYDLTGIGPLIIGYHPMAPTLPLELWTCRPDKLFPVKDPKKFISGWFYEGPNGEKIPLKLNEVLRIRRPDPLDPYGGIGAVQSVMTDIQGSKLRSEYNYNFFKNSAEPGGIITMDEELEEEEFNRFVRRWQEQHKGVSRAHRVAILERGAKWVDRKYTNKDMQLTELRVADREVIREAFRFPLPMMGTVENVNRANADAAQVTFARWLVNPRLERIKSMLNTQFLPLFGDTGDLEFDFENPIPEDREADNKELDVKVRAAVSLISQGADPASTLEALGLPDIEFKKPEPLPLPAPPDPDGELRALLAGMPPVLNRAPLWTPRAAEDSPALPNLANVQTSWMEALSALLEAWREVDLKWNAEILDQVLSAASSGDFEALTRLSVDYGDAADLLANAMRALGTEAAGQVAEEAADQGVDITAIGPTLAAVTPVANAVTSFLAFERAISAGREAIRVMGPVSTGADVAELVEEHLTNLTNAQQTLHLGGALTSSQHIARYDTMRAAPQAAYYANEVLDRNTCRYCKEIDGKWLGNDLMHDVPKSYPMSGYILCLGRQRCRGFVSAVWRKRQVGDE
jgi:HK97 family phage portal protein